jgi:hypothetical protein
MVKTFNTHIVEEKPTNPSKKWSINGCERATQPVPLASTVMGYGRVRMMEICEHNNPVIHQLHEHINIETRRIE